MNLSWVSDDCSFRFQTQLDSFVDFSDVEIYLLSERFCMINQSFNSWVAVIKNQKITQHR